MGKHVDVLIAGAGISGIAAAYYLQRHCPDKSYAIVEAREAIGGTWDLFRYPGIRSDSDMYTFGYSFYPWSQPQAMAPAPAILDYLDGAVDTFGIREQIEFGHRVEKLSFSTDDSRWLVRVRNVNEDSVSHYTCNFFWGCIGYYRYDVETHFNPRYDPWDQRLCMVPDGDLFQAINAGKASVVTDRTALDRDLAEARQRGSLARRAELQGRQTNDARESHRRWRAHVLEVQK